MGLDIATRFVLPAILLFLFNWLIAAENRFGLSVAMAVISVATAVLTSRSTKLTRATGYAAAAVIAVFLALDVLDKQGSWARDGWSDGVMYDSPYTLQLLFHAACVLSIATYRYRDVKTRRALWDHDTSDSDNTSTP